MANLKELRGRIKSVASIAQITRAMEMVASMKLRKVQARAQAFHPYVDEIRHMIEALAGKVANEGELPLFQGREVKTVGMLVIASDRGLCGSYNSNLLFSLKKVADALLAEGKLVKFWVYGRKAYSWLTRRGYAVERFFVEPPLDKADFTAAKLVGQALVDAFTTGAVDEVRVYYTRFQSMVKFAPTDAPFLPIRTIATGEAAAKKGYELDFLLEPDATTVFNRLMPRYLETVVFDAMLQSLTSEHASRRMAMKGATDAAVRMNKGLKKVYNRARQENITKELLDIVGGASAVS
ncbi:MAG: ATP synthase F1 subunit gamma [Planctomycetes bacterium]|nr:ATP synthase F1 subunit gamma [Planctomycetota bacterium]MCC7399820.1 ATP synthase F1 subunit gamma [Planctomycetota bacterium]